MSLRELKGVESQRILSALDEVSFEFEVDVVSFEFGVDVVSFEFGVGGLGSRV